MKKVVGLACLAVFCAASFSFAADKKDERAGKCTDAKSQMDYFCSKDNAGGDTLVSLGTACNNAKDNVAAEEISELVIHPGETISTFIAIERGKADDDVPYGKDDSGRNLPHGIFIDNIGLSGLVIKPGQNTREVFVTAAPWLQPQIRPFHLRTTLKGSPTTKPIMLRVEAR